MFRAGDKFAGYEILERLKGGGMATLFLARRVGASGFRKHVAIKVVHQHLAEDDTFVHMFVDEALLSSRIHHPNVVHIEELRQFDGQHFLVMEYVAGVSLAQLLRRLSKLGRGMNPELAAYVAIQIADGLHAAHELRDETGRLEGLVHRDISPQNVLIAWEGHVKLIDFGVAKARSRMQQTTGASLKGKIRYMAPEQAVGRDVDRRTDVYALGIVLWEMLTMRRRFRGQNDFALLEQVRTPEPIPPSQHRSDVSAEFDAVVLHAMERRIEDRFQTAKEFRRALAKAIPSALALDSSHLSDFVRAACQEELGKARDRLPGSMALPLTAAELKAQAAPLKTMTVSADQIVDFTDSVSVSVSFTPSSVSVVSPEGVPSSSPPPNKSAPDVAASDVAASDVAASDSAASDSGPNDQRPTKRPAKPAVVGTGSDAEAAAPVPPPPVPPASLPSPLPVPAVAPAAEPSGGDGVSVGEPSLIEEDDPSFSELSALGRRRMPLVAAAVAALVVITTLVVVFWGSLPKEAAVEQTEPLAGPDFVQDAAVAAPDAAPLAAPDAAAASQVASNGVDASVSPVDAATRSAHHRPARHGSGSANRHTKRGTMRTTMRSMRPATKLPIFGDFDVPRSNRR